MSGGGGSVHATRLESLFLLVRDGSSAQIRENAAEKLGEVAIQSPEYCHSILQQLRPLILDPKWEIRVAASKCLDVVARSLRHEPENVADQFAVVSLGSRNASCMALNLQTVDIAKVVHEGAPLLRSGGEEYQYVTNLTEEGRREHVGKQRRLLLRRLSGAAGPIWKTREDSLTKQLLPRLNRDHVQEIADDIEESEAQPGLRDEPHAKGDRKQASEMLSIAIKKKLRSANDHGEPTSGKKRVKVEHQADTGASSISATDDNSNEPPAPTKLSVVANLVTDLFECMFDSKWEARHGALLSMRQILLSAHFTAAVEATGSASCGGTQREFVDKWLEECLIRCICVLALDQFVDYSADGSISPVREVCAQVFGILLGSLYSETVLVGYLQVVRTLFTGSTWYACHGALLGLKYLIQAHKPHATMLVPLIFKDVVTAFSQSASEEDVLILTAEMFADFTLYLGKVGDMEVKRAARLLWGSLKLHESAGLITASTMRALSEWYNHPPLAGMLQDDNEVASVIWQNLTFTVPMLHHHSRSVGMSTATCIAAIFSGGSSFPESRPTDFARGFLPHLLLQLLRERDDSVQQSLICAWKSVVSTCSANGFLVSSIADRLLDWITLLWSTDGLNVLNVELNTSSSTGIGASSDLVSNLVGSTARESASSRVAFADAIGFLAAHLPLSSSSMSGMVRLIRDGFSSASGERQCGALLVLSRWGSYEKQLRGGEAEMVEKAQRIQHLLDSVGVLLDRFARNQWKVEDPVARKKGKLVFYTEQLRSLKRVRQMEARIIAVFSSVGIALQPAERPDSASAADISRQIAEHVALFPYEKLRIHANEYETAHFKRQDLFLVDELVQQGFARFYHRIQGLGSCAFCVLLPIPTKKCGFLVKALMDAVKEEEEPVFRRISAEAIADFVVSQAVIQKKCVSKIISNLCNSATALVGQPGGPFDDLLGSSCSEDASSASISPDLFKKTKMRVGGATAALRAICEKGDRSVFSACRSLEEAISRAWEQKNTDSVTIQRCMYLITLVVPHVTGDAVANCLTWLDHLTQLVQQPFDDGQTKRIVAHAIATICKHAQHSYRENAMMMVYNSIFVAFSSSGDAQSAKKEVLEGAVMVLDWIVHSLKADLTPYVPSLVHYAMKTMSSQFKLVRTLAARAFAALVPLIPLQMDLELHQTSQLVSDSLRTIVSENAVSRCFLESFLEGKAVQHTDVRSWLAPKVSLRTYQQHGVDWLRFMSKNSLHGILADDMGLGKTLQALAAMVATLRVHSATNSQEREAIETKNTTPVCLIVCPPIIVHHWILEAEKYFPGVFGVIVDYSKPAGERKTLCRNGRLPISARHPTLIVTTYTILRTDIERLAAIDFAFVVLDEAHLIRNPATALFRAVLKLQAAHRVALSGTPLQNNVTDLWALFEFLMPGYLGDFASFRREFVLPITKSKERNATAKQKELAAIAITQLHQKVLPFILRRTKDQVLEELPPKIISNVLLPLSPLQKLLYSLASSADGGATTGSRSTPNEGKTKQKPLANVLTNLQLLRKICVHPALVETDAVARGLNAKDKRALGEWKSSGKMVGLRDLLVECCDMGDWGQGRQQGGEIDTASQDDGGISPHRCLVFAHLQKTLDVTEQMLQEALPTVTYRRLDGQTPHSERADIVKHFNADPSIDVLLLTTAVGGLGLTLTGADTVIFVEHSWNPFVDLQAMDRAHRIGQKRTVRVFRLIMKETLEEHILNLQTFKEQVAATVVQKSDAQSSMNSNTKGVLGLLQASSSAVVARELRASIAAKGSEEDEQDIATILPHSAQELLGQLGELWDESQYDSLAFPESSRQ